MWPVDSKGMRAEAVRPIRRLVLTQVIIIIIVATIVITNTRIIANAYLALPMYQLHFKALHMCCFI